MISETRRSTAVIAAHHAILAVMDLLSIVLDIPGGGQLPQHLLDVDKHVSDVELLESALRQAREFYGE